MIFNDEKIEEILFRENVTIASFSHRLGAFLADGLLVFCLTWVFCFCFLLTPTTIEAKIFFIQKFIISLLIICFFYEFFFVLFFGASIGKIIFKIRIISVLSLDKPDIKSTLVRCLMKILDEIACFLPFVFALEDSFLRPLHDKFAKTIVISIE